MVIRSRRVALREFDASLTDVLYEIRNHPTVRTYMRDPAPLALESHREWVRKNLIEARRLRLFVVFHGKKPVGIALLRNLREHSAEVGLMVVEAAKRPLVCYVAANLIAYYGFEMLGLERMFSYVTRRNRHALSFNLRCGFEETGAPSEDYHELILTRRASRSNRTHQRFRTTRPIEVLENA